MMNDDALMQRLVLAFETMAGLRQVPTETEGTKLGFAPLPEPKQYRTIYANRDADILWYMLGDVNQRTGKRTKIPLTEDERQSFIGRLTNIEIVEVTRKDDQNQAQATLKAYIVLDADEPTKIETSPHTIFFHNFVAIASNLAPEQLANPIQIVPDPEGTTRDTVMWCRIFDPIAQTYVRKADWARGKSEVNWHDRINALISQVRQANDSVQADGIMGNPKRYSKDAEEAEEATEPEEATDGGAEETSVEQTNTPAANASIDNSDLITNIGLEIDRLGWSKRQGSRYLSDTYGKKTRAELTDDELEEFLEHLKAQPDPVAEPVTA